MSNHTTLENRGLVAITGEDCHEFLQGIVTNDVTRVTDTQAGYGAFLTPQGKYLFDFFMVHKDNGFLMDTEKDRVDAFIKRLSMYKLRAKVEVADVSEQFRVNVVFGQGALESALDRRGLESRTGAAMAINGGVVFVDPRLVEAGLRTVEPVAGPDIALWNDAVSKATEADYNRHRINLGLPDGNRDMIVEKSVLLENGFDELNGVDWNKGCYMGQEVTARTKYRGLVKKRLVPVSIDGPAPEAGTPVTSDEREVGEMRSSAVSTGLALIKLDYLTGKPLSAGEAILIPEKPAWATF